MRKEKSVRDIDTAEIETLLKKALYRYQLAIKDGAVNSIINEVMKRINELEKELELRAETTSS